MKKILPGFLLISTLVWSIPTASAIYVKTPWSRFNSSPMSSSSSSATSASASAASVSSTVSSSSSSASSVLVPGIPLLPKKTVVLSRRTASRVKHLVVPGKVKMMMENDKMMRKMQHRMGN